MAFFFCPRVNWWCKAAKLKHVAFNWDSSSTLPEFVSTCTTIRLQFFIFFVEVIAISFIPLQSVFDQNKIIMNYYKKRF